MKRRYLIGFDGSEASRNATRWFKRAFDPEHTGVVLLSVGEPIPDSVRADLPLLNPDLDFDELHEQQARRRSRPALNELTEKGFEVRLRTDVGQAGPNICRVAEEEDVDGIVIGRKGETALPSLLMGSVSRYVSQHASVPVIIVPMEFSTSPGVESES